MTTDDLLTRADEFDAWTTTETSANALVRDLAAALRDATEPHCAPWVTAVASVVGIDDPGAWNDEFVALYKPDEWLSKERAAAVFIGVKLKDLRERAERAEDALEGARKFIAWVGDNLEKPMYSNVMNRMGMAEDCKGFNRGEMNKRWLDATWQMDRAVKAEAERDSLRALLREAREYCYPVNPSPADTSNMRFRIDALLAKDKS